MRSTKVFKKLAAYDGRCRRGSQTALAHIPRGRPLCTSPATAIAALRSGVGIGYETTQKQRSAGKDLTFEFTAGIKDRVSDAMAALSGPFVQGPRSERFVYIDVGTFAGQVDSCWSRRLKIPLAGITMKMVQAGNVLEARVPGTGRDGSPSCATGMNQPAIAQPGPSGKVPPRRSAFFA